MNLTRLRGSVGLTALLVITGCHEATDPVASQQAALAHAEALWYASGIHDYRFDIGSHSVWFQDSLRIEVRSDTVAGATSLRAQQSHGAAATVPELFASIRTGLASNRRVKATYDAKFGYPTRIDMPDPPNVADTAWWANIGNFTR